MSRFWNPKEGTRHNHARLTDFYLQTTRQPDNRRTMGVILARRLQNQPRAPTGRCLGQRCFFGSLFLRAAPLHTHRRIPGSWHRNTTCTPACWEQESTSSQCYGLDVHGPGTCPKKRLLILRGRDPSRPRPTPPKPTEHSLPTRLCLSRSRPVFGFQLGGCQSASVK